MKKIILITILLLLAPLSFAEETLFTEDSVPPAARSDSAAVKDSIAVKDTAAAKDSAGSGEGIDIIGLFTPSEKSGKDSSKAKSAGMTKTVPEYTPEPNPQTSNEVEVPLNIGIGPALFWIPGIASREWHPGFTLAPYGVITPQALAHNKDKIPAKYRRYLNSMREIHVAPAWMILIPTYVIVSPGALGSDDAVYGAIWSLLSIGPDFITKRNFILEGKASPTISYLHVNSDDNKDKENLVGIGAMLHLSATYAIKPTFLMTLAYGHLFQLPLGITEYKPTDKASQHWFQAGTLSLTFHFRFITMQNL